MGRYLARRIAGAVPLLFGITFLSFAVIHLAPGGPVEAKAGLNPKMTAQAREKLATLYGLDKPLVERYRAWLGRAVRLDFGESFADGEKVSVKIGRAVPVTLLVSGLSLVLVLLVGIPLGVYSAVRAGTRADSLVSGIVLFGFSAPTFWIALGLMSFFGVTLQWLPVTGLHSLFHEEMAPLERAVDLAWHLVLPVAVSAFAGLAAVTRFMRGSMLEALSQNYVRAARAKGLSEPRVLYRHALRNALLPVVTLVGLSVPGLLGGSVIFESIFSIPGMGSLFYASVFSRDYPVIMGILVLGAVLTLVGNLLADLAYAAVDPRIRLE